MTSLIRFLWNRCAVAPCCWTLAAIEWRPNGMTERWFNLSMEYAFARAGRWHWPYGKKRISNIRDNLP